MQIQRNIAIPVWYLQRSEKGGLDGFNDFRLMALGPCPRRDPRARHCGCSCVAAWRNHRIINGTHTTSEAGLSRTSSDVRFSAAVRGIAVTPDLSRSDLCVHALPAFALAFHRVLSKATVLQLIGSWSIEVDGRPNETRCSRMRARSDGFRR